MANSFLRTSLLVCLFFIYSSKCAILNTEWWKHTIIYELIPYSFKDSDGDGIGDIKGITSKMDHFVDLGIDTIHLTPNFMTSGMDMGYDITDFYEIEPKLGTIDDFDELIREMKKRDMKLLLDLVINHSGHEHEWFQKSINRIEPYTDYYVWQDSKGFDNETQKEIPPNTWSSIFSGSGWTWNEKRKQFYFHQFLAEQPDFNLRNEDLKKELKKMIEFWLDRGVSGFRLDATPFYFEDKEFRDDTWSRQYEQPETFDFIHEFRMFLDEYNVKYGGFERIFIAEAHTNMFTLIKYYGTEDYPVTHFPYSFALEYMEGLVGPASLSTWIYWSMMMLPAGKVSAWMTQDHDTSRVGSRMSPEYSDIFTMLSMMLPGTVGVYYGQEIAMVDGFITTEQMKDFSGRGTRDPNRLLMQWDDSVNAGFSTNITAYLPSNTDYYERNVESQRIKKNSHYNLFKDLSSLRKTNTVKFGTFEQNTPTESIYTLTRSYENNKLTVVMNLSEVSSRVDLTTILPDNAYQITIVAASVNLGYSSGFKVEQELWDEFFMRPMSSVVFETNHRHVQEKIVD